MAQKDIALNILGRMDDYRREVSKLPGVTDEEAGKAALKMQARFARAAQKQLRDQQKAAQKSQQAWSRFAKVAAGAMAAIAAVKSLEFLVDMRQELADLTNEMGDASAQTGISVETLNAFRVAAASSGAELKTLIPGLRQFPKRLSDMSMGTGEAKVAFEQLGFTQEDARKGLEDTDGMLREVIRRMKEVPDAGRQADIATRLWGESGAILNQVLGNNSIDQWVEAAQGGVDVSEEAIRAGQVWQVEASILTDRWVRFKQEMFGTAGAIGEVTGSFQLNMARMMAAIESMTKTAITLAVNFREQLRGLATRDMERVKKANSALKVAVEWAWDDVQTAVERATLEFNNAKDTMLSGADAAREQGRALGTTTIEQQKAAAAAREHANALKAQEAAMTKVQSLIDAAVSDQLSAEEAILAAAAARFQEVEDMRLEGTISEEQAMRAQVAINQRAMRDIVAAHKEAADKRLEAEQKLDGELDRILQDRLAEMAQMAQETKRIWESVIDGVVGTAQDVFDAFASHFQRQASDARALVDQLRDTRESDHERLQELRDEEREIAIALADDTLQANTRAQLESRRQENLSAQQAIRNSQRRTDQQLKDSEKIAKDAKKRMKAFVIASRAVAIFDIAVKTAQAVMTALAQLGPIAGGIAGGIITATGVAQAALVAAEPMPSFFGGTSRIPGGRNSAGEGMVRAHAGEAVLNSRAAGNLGRDIIDALNSGLSPLQAFAGGGSAPVVLDGEVVGMVMARRARRGGEFGLAVRGSNVPVGFRNPFGRN